jgi:integrase
MQRLTTHADIHGYSFTHGLRMAAFSKLPSGLWRVQVARNGVRRSASFPTKSAAQQWASQLEVELLASKRGGYPRKTVAQALDRYAEEVSPSKRGERWERLRLAAFGRERWAAKWLVDLTSDDLGKWRDLRLLAVSGESVRRDFSLLSAVLSTARKEWGWMGENPVTDVRKPPAGRPRARLPGWREIRLICRSCGYVTGRAPTTLTGEIAYVLLISLRTAMRRGEILGLSAADVDLERGLAVLHMTKNGDRREVPLSQKAVRLVSVLLPGMLSIAPASLDALWRKVCARVGVAGLHLHDARAAALTSMARRVDVLTLARISGHRDIKMLMRYYRETPQQIAARL